MPRVIITVKAGMVTAVYSDDPDVAAIVVDYDNIAAGDDDAYARQVEKEIETGSLHEIW